MAMGQSFEARWDGSSTFMFVTELVGFGMFGWMVVGPLVGVGGNALLGVILLSPTVYLLLYSVWGYRIEGNKLLVRRLLWTTTVDLSDVEATALEPALIKESRVIFFSGHRALRWVGSMKHPKYGRYQSYCVNRDKVVVLAKKSGMVAVSPEDTVGFVKAVGAG